MEKQIEVVEQLTELLPTMEQGLDHINTNFKEGKFEATFPMLVEVIQSFSAVENAVNGLRKN